AARAMQLRHRPVQVVAPLPSDRPLGLLARESCPGEIPIQKSRQQRISQDRQKCRRAEPILTPSSVSHAEDGVRNDLRLYRPTHRARRMADVSPGPVKLRRVDCRKLHDAEADLGPFMQQLRSE